MASFVKKLLVRDAGMLLAHATRQELGVKKRKTHLFLPVQETRVRAPVLPVGRLVRCTPTVPTAPARTWSACGAAARSVASTRPPMSSLSLMASVWSGRPEIVWVSVLSS